MLTKLIINADDFGYSTPRNKAIVECFEKRYITQTTLMVNMPGCDEAVEWARQNGFANKVGLHLNFTEGFPLTERIKKFPRLCASDGSFVRNHPFVAMPYLGAERAAVKAEILAQVRKYKSFGLPLMHCDGHHHIQSRWPMADVLFPILKSEGFKSFRNVYPFPRYDTNNRLLRFSRYTVGNEFLRLLKGRHLKYADVFMDWDICRKWIGVLPERLTAELMVHPRYGENGILFDGKNPMSELSKMVKGI